VNVEAFHLPGLGAGAFLISQADRYLPFHEFFFLLGAWLLLWLVCTLVRIAKNFLLENCW
jgi:hypothetical protein